MLSGNYRPDHHYEPEWTIGLLRRRVSPGSSQPDDDTWAFEIICRLCGDDPGVVYRDAPAHFRQIRGPYDSSTAGVAAFLQHNKLHDADEQANRHAPAQPVSSR
jgi:hypothetical protein